MSKHSRVVLGLVAGIVADGAMARTTADDFIAAARDISDKRAGSFRQRIPIRPAR